METPPRSKHGTIRSEKTGRSRLEGSHIDVLVGERARFLRFLSRQLGNEADANDLLQQSLLRALKRQGSVRRGEHVVPWFYQILRNVIADHYRQKAKESRRNERLWSEITAKSGSREKPPADWEAALCACFKSLLPTLKPRYGAVLSRIDLNGEDKQAVARDLKIKRATLDVLLHRARHRLRERLEIFCGACSQDGCLLCMCGVREKRPKPKV
ncbi:MAG: sigma-70 family RNA polymerase sigma factor [Opitutaceae bacterium]